MTAKRVFTPFAIVLLFILPSCVRSVTPLSDPQKAEPDERLLGKWEFRDAEINVKISLEISPHPAAKQKTAKVAPGMMKVKISFPESAKAASVEGDLFISKIGEESFANLGLFAEPKNKEKLPDKKALSVTIFTEKMGWNVAIFKYEIVEDKLTLYETNPIDEVIKKKMLKGVLVQGILFSRSIDESYLTDSTENMAEFIKKGGSKHLFSAKKIIFERK